MSRRTHVRKRTVGTAQAKTLRLLLGDQLNERHSWFRRIDANVSYVLMEVMQETSYVKQHIQKVAGFFAAMRAFADKLRRQGHHVIYLRLDDPQNRQTFDDNIHQLLKQDGYTRFEYLLPDEYRLDRQLQTLAARLPVSHGVSDTEHFLTNRLDVQEMFEGGKRFVMEFFYRRMRKRLSVLMHGDEPIGGQWNYDAHNRSKYDDAAPIPQPLFFQNNVSEIVSMLARMNVPTFGEIDPEHFLWPVTREQGVRLLRAFVKHGLPHFGTYQDAMVARSWTLFHSRLSFALNTKMLHPLETIHAAIREWEKRKDEINLQQVEGFVRQILGWREYMRGIYWTLMPGLATMNFFNHRAALPHYYWDGNTRMHCMRITLEQSLRNAYAHHIQRLMVTGNFALLAGVHPDEIGAWYLGVYLDAIEWVEMPNTRGMSQFADGGIIATKPYTGTANYLHKMSDYCTGCHYDRRAKYGARACPFNNLYWDFHVRHRQRLQTNPRLGMVYRTWDKMSGKEQTQILRQAKVYQKHLEAL